MNPRWNWRRTGDELAENWGAGTPGEGRFPPVTVPPKGGGLFVTGGRPPFRSRQFASEVAEVVETSAPPLRVGTGDELAEVTP
jgi:hypothetical protein